MWGDENRLENDSGRCSQKLKPLQWQQREKSNPAPFGRSKREIRILFAARNSYDLTNILNFILCWSCFQLFCHQDMSWDQGWHNADSSYAVTSDLVPLMWTTECAQWPRKWDHPLSAGRLWPMFGAKAFLGCQGGTNLASRTPSARCLLTSGLPC